MIYLTEPQLGRLDLGPLVLGGGVQQCNADGYVVTGWEIGFPAERAVVRNAALADGVFDSTRFWGARAVSMAVTIDVNKQDPQLAIDALTAYMTPHRRPRLAWTIPGSVHERSLVVRGVDAPLSIQGKQAHTMAASFIGIHGTLESNNGNGPDGVNSISIVPSVEGDSTGREYDLTFDRIYPYSPGRGEHIIDNKGNEIADWRCTISAFGGEPVVNPILSINGIDMSFTENGGLTLQPNESVTIDTRDRTALWNNDPNESRYDRLNYLEWAWEDVRLKPGKNSVRYEEQADNGMAVFEWRDTWL